MKTQVWGAALKLSANSVVPRQSGRAFSRGVAERAEDENTKGTKDTKERCVKAKRYFGFLDTKREVGQMNRRASMKLWAEFRHKIYLCSLHTA